MSQIPSGGISMSFISAFVFAIIALLPITASTQEAELVFDNHPVIKCNFTNAEAEPRFLTAIIDPEWSQVVTVSRENKLLPPATGLKLQLKKGNTKPITYVWTMLKKDGKPYVHIQEIPGEPPRYTILGRKPGTYECYRQESKNIEYYKRF